MRDAMIVQDAPQPLGHYSHAVISNGLAFVSAQGPVDGATGEVPGDFAGQVRQTLRNLDTILRGVGSDLGQTVKMTVYLQDLANFSAFNAVYKEFFPGRPPARSVIGCQLLDDMVEMDCIAALYPE